MKRCTAALGLIAATLLALPGARAQGAPGAAPAAAPVTPEDERGWIRGRLGVGLHLAGGSMSDSSNDAAEPVGFGGGGLQVRYLLWPRWELELSLGGISSESAEVDRELGVATIGALYHFNPRSRWVWSVLAGFGFAGETASIKSDGEVVMESELENGIFYLGGGLERRFGNVSVAAELRLVGMARDDEAADGPALAGKDSPVPREMGGAQFRLMGTYYF